MARDSISNILLQLSGKDTGATETLDTFVAKLQAFGQESVSATADVSVKGQEKLLALATELAAFAGTTYDAKVGVDLEPSKLAALAVDLNAITMQDYEAHVNVMLSRASWAKVQADLAALSARELPVDVVAKLREESLAKVAAEITAFTATYGKVLPDIPIDVHLKGIAETMAALAALEVEEKVVKDAGRGGLLQNILSSGAAQKALSLFTGLQTGVTNLESAATGAFGKIGDSIGGVTVNLGLFGLKLGPAVAAVLALAVAIGVSLVGALSLLVTAAIGAGAAIGALAASFAAALGPGVLLAVATIARLATALKTVKDLNAAKAASDRKSADGTDAAATAAEQQRKKLEGVRDALFAVISANRSYKQAQQSAADAITTAQREQAAAAQSLSDANATLKQTTSDAYDAIKKAALDLSDAFLSVKDARLSVKEAGLSVKQAANELANFRNQSKTAGQTLDGLFKKFSDVNFKGNVQSGLEKLGVSKKDSLEGEKLILALQRAKLNEQQATNRLTHSERDLGAARTTNNKFQREGISAYKPYTDAIRQQRDAQQRLTDTTKKANELERQGIANAPAVVSARQSLVEAENRLRDARREAMKAGDGIPDQAAKAKQEFDALSPPWQRLVTAIIGAKKELGKLDITGPIADALAYIIGRAPAVLRGLIGPFQGFASTVGDVIKSIFNAFDNPAAKLQFLGLILAARDLAKILGGKAFVSFIKLFLNVATAAMPYLISLSGKLANALAGLAGKSSRGNGLRKFLAKAFALLGDVYGLAKALGRVFLAFFNATDKQSGGFLKWLTASANKFADFLNSAKGKKDLAKFFSDTLPLVKAFLGFIGQLIVLIIRFTQIIAPAATAFIQGFTLILKVLNFVLGILRPMLQLFVQIGAIAFGGGMLGRLKAGEGLLRAFVGSLLGLPGKMVAKVAGAIAKLFQVMGVLNSLGGLFRGIGNLASAGFHAAGRAAGAMYSLISHVFASIVGSAARHFGQLPGTLAHFIHVMYRDAIKLAGDFVAVGKALVNGLITGITSLAGKLYKVAKKVFSAPGKLVHKIFRVNSPSKVFMEIGKSTIEGFNLGLDRNKSSLNQGVKQTFNPAVSEGRRAVRMARPRLNLGDALATAGGTSIGDIILQTAEGGTPDGHTAAAQIKRTLRRMG